MNTSEIITAIYFAIGFVIYGYSLALEVEFGRVWLIEQLLWLVIDVCFWPIVVIGFLYINKDND